MENIIKKRRLELGLTQAALAKMIGITQQHLDRYEKGYQIPVEKIPHVAKVLNIDMWLLLPADFEKPTEVLTEDEKEDIIIECVIKGLNNKQIYSELCKQSYKNIPDGSNFVEN